MLSKAHYDHLIVNDSDIRVESDYLQRVIAPLSNPKVGMVTCLYRGVPSKTLGSRLESLGISTDFCGGVLSAREVESGIHFALGSTLAFRRNDLQAIGGFEAVVDYLADDYELGQRISARGLHVKLSEVVVETFLPAYKFRQFFDHQLRWARSVARCAPLGISGSDSHLRVPWALLVLASIRGTYWAWGLAISAVIMRMVVAFVVGRLVLKRPLCVAMVGSGSSPRFGRCGCVDCELRRTHGGVARNLIHFKRWQIGQSSGGLK